MLQSFMPRLRAERIILASSSLQRKQILENIGLKVDIIPSAFEENLDKSSFEKPSDYVRNTALFKALDTARTLAVDSVRPFLVIGADTVVTMDERIYEKPSSRQDAFDMLSSFSGRSHSVCTGVALLTPSLKFSEFSLPVDQRYEVELFHALTDVEFEEMDAETVWAYVDSGEPMDKAGGYGIQTLGGTLVKGIHGDYFNVMGFPVNLFSRHLVYILRRKS